MTRWIHAIVVVAAIALSGGCLMVDDPGLSCGDDVGYYTGLDVELTGGDEDAVHEVTVEAEGASLVVNGSGDSASVELGDGRALTGYMYRTVSPLVITLNVSLRDDPDRDGPATALVIVRADGLEVARHTFTPTYDRVEPWGPGCQTFGHARETLALSP